jgi:hypothetical protein
VILHLAKVGLDVVRGAVGTDHVGDAPVLAVAEEDPLAEEFFLAPNASLAFSTTRAAPRRALISKVLTGKTSSRISS